MRKDFHVKVFIACALIFNVLVGSLYLAAKFNHSLLLSILGFLIISLIIPFTYTFIKFYKSKEKKSIWVSNAIIIFYLIFEMLLDYVLRIPFRDIVWLHVIYNIVLWMALFSMIAIVRRKAKKMIYALIASLIFLISCLTYLIIG